VPPRLRTRPAPATLAALGLIAVTASWGSTFVVVKEAVERMPVLDFLAVRFAVATAVMVLLRPATMRRINPLALRHGGVLGVALGLGFVAQTVGLQHTSAAVSGFITGMYVVFTPLIAAVVLRHAVSGWAWLAVAVATGGLALLSLRGFSVGSGELLTLLCAVFFAVHIVGLGEWSAGHDAYPLAVVQLAVVAALCGAAAAPGGVTLPPGAATWGAVALTAVAATAFAFVVQTWAQARLSATRAAVIMTAEPVFAGLFAVLLGGERLGPRTVVGAALVLAAMYLVELGPRRAADATVERLEV